MLLKDKVALVTGASRGIGAAVARRYAEHGASVLLLARSAAVHDVAAGLRQFSGRFISIQGDITDDAAVRDCVKTCRAQFGRLDVLVNNAGAMPRAVIGMIPMAEAQRSFELNVLALINLTQYAVRLMKADASIVNISSIAWKGIAGASVYSAAKGAVASFTMAAAKELGPRGIRVNAIAPGFIDTVLTAELPAEIRDRTLAGIRLARAGTPDDVAGVAVFLASGLSAYVTGQVLGVDGGMAA